MVGAFGPCPDRAQLPALLEQAKSKDLDAAKKARGAIVAYLWDTHLAFIQKHARQDWGNGISTQSLALNVITEMLGEFEEFINIEHVCKSFRRRIVGRALDRQRTRVRQRKAAESLTDSLKRKDSTSHTDELERLDLVQHMIQALREHNPDLAAAVELRYLAADGTDTTFIAIGRALGVADSTAHERATKGEEWLRQNFPQQPLF